MLHDLGSPDYPTVRHIKITCDVCKLNPKCDENDNIVSYDEVVILEMEKHNEDIRLISPANRLDISWPEIAVICPICKNQYKDYDALMLQLKDLGFVAETSV